MKIRPDQMEPFQRQSQQVFEERLTAHIRERYGDCPVMTSEGAFLVSELTDDCVFGMIVESINRARAYGFTWESSTAAYTALMYVVGPGFDQHPAIREALLDPDVPQNSRIDHLRYTIPRLAWNEAREAHGPHGWSSAFPSLVFRRVEVKSA